MGVWANREFRRLYAASTTSVFGSMLSGMAIPWIAIDVLGASDGSVAALGALRLLPGFLFGFFAGAWVDRLRRKPLLIGADLGRAALFSCVPLVFVFGSLDLWWLGGVVFFAATLTVLFEVAEHSYLPAIVERDQLVEGNAELTGGAAIAEGIGFFASGWLARWISAPMVLGVDAATFLVSARLLAGIRVAESLPERRSQRTGMAELAEGFDGLARVSELRAIAVVETLRGFAVGVFFTTYMLWVMRELGFGMAAIGSIAAVGSLGSFIGSRLAPRLDARLGAGPAMLAALALTALSYLLIPTAPNAGVVGALFLIGHQLLGDTFETVWNIGSVSMRQRLADPARLGRVNGTIRALASAMTMVAALLSTVLIGWTGAQPLLFAAVGAMALAVVSASRSVLRAEPRSPR